MTAQISTPPPEELPEPPPEQGQGLTLPMRRFIGLLLVALVIAVIEFTGRPAGLDPAVLIPMAVLAGAAIDGLLGGGLAAGVGGTYIALYYVSAVQAVAPVPGAPARLLVGLAASALAVLVAIVFRDRVTAERSKAQESAAEEAAISAFALRVANERPDSVAPTLVAGVAQLLEADMVVLTVLDPPSGRHVVRAAHGGSSSPVGVEVLPGVGITGQAIRDRRLVIVGGNGDRAVNRLQRRLGGRATAQTMAAVPGTQAGRVVVTVTVGRSDGAQFGERDQRMLNAVAPVVTLAVSGSLTRREMEDGSPRDTVTGLYNKAYLDAALEQVIALRRRTAPEQRPPLSMIMFDIDSFALINERYGRPVGDHVLRSVATLLRQRFRASDIVARIGPDSFMVAMNGADADVAADAAAHIRRQVRELNLASTTGEPIIVSLSAGCAAYHDGERTDALYRSVEAALDTARWSGPGAVVTI